MSKALRKALLPLFGLLLFSGPSAAGPGGNRNGDPDRPQGTNPSFVEPYDTFQVNPGSPSPGSRPVIAITDTQRFVLRIYLRLLSGVTLR